MDITKCDWCEKETEKFPLEFRNQFGVTQKRDLCRLCAAKITALDSKETEVTGRLGYHPVTRACHASQ